MGMFPIFLFWHFWVSYRLFGVIMVVLDRILIELIIGVGLNGFSSFVQQYGYCGMLLYFTESLIKRNFQRVYLSTFFIVSVPH